MNIAYKIMDWINVYKTKLSTKTKIYFAKSIVLIIIYNLHNTNMKQRVTFTVQTSS
jgi:hypothetical protein